MAKPKAKKGFKRKLNNDKLDIEFRKARLDVFKFGVKHLSKKDKEATKYDQLVRLGAEVSACLNWSTSFFSIVSSLV